MDRQKRLTQWVNEKPSSKEQKSLPANPPLPPPLSKGGIPSGHALFPPLRRKGETGNASNLRFVVPAKAGTQLCTRQEDSREKKKRSSLPFFVLVVPAKAGIQFVKCLSKKRKNFLDPGLRRDDETKENEFQLPFLG